MVWLIVCACVRACMHVCVSLCVILVYFGSSCFLVRVTAMDSYDWGPNLPIERETSLQGKELKILSLTLTTPWWSMLAVAELFYYNAVQCMQVLVYAVIICQSVCLSHLQTMSKWLHSLAFYRTKNLDEILTASPLNNGRTAEAALKSTQFLTNMWLVLEKAGTQWLQNASDKPSDSCQMMTMPAALRNIWSSFLLTKNSPWPTNQHTCAQKCTHLMASFKDNLSKPAPER